MNRYDVFQLVQELGRLIEGARGKTNEEVARELIACGQKWLADAQAVGQPVNGIAIPTLPDKAVAVLPAEGLPSVTVPPTLLGTSQA